MPSTSSVMSTSPAATSRCRSVIAAEMFCADEKVNHLTHGDSCGLMQLRMKAHADVMCRRFGARIFLAGAFVHDELQRADQRSSSAVMSTSPLPCPACPSPTSKSAPRACTGRKSVVPTTSSLLSMLPAWQAGRRTVNASEAFRRRNAHAAKERMQGNLNARREPGDHALSIQRNDLHLAIRKVFRAGSRAWDQKRCTRTEWPGRSSGCGLPACLRARLLR